MSERNHSAPYGATVLVIFTLIACSCGGSPTGGVSRSTVAANKSAEPASTASTAAPMVAEPQEAPSGESYGSVDENPFVAVRDTPLSTFSVDVDTASYSNVRRFLHDGELPPADAVRTEELVNYFAYDYPQPVGEIPFSVTTETAACPWNPAHRVLQIGLKGRQVETEELPPANLVFLVDTSGSMQSPDKLPLLVRSLEVLVDQLRDRDRVAIVTYAGSSGVALPSTAGDRKEAIKAALSNLSAGGSTNGGAGIAMAYEIAERSRVANGVNRVVLATDGDFNVGITSQDELVGLIERERRSGVFLTVLGFGTGNLKDSTMEKLADRGNGNYAYIDTIEEGRNVLGRELGATLDTIAKDVKIQIGFNPETVRSYRLIGYENRVLAAQDFDDDAKDAGEIGAGHTVTALYELVPSGRAPARRGDLATVELRYKEPSGEESHLLKTSAVDGGKGLDAASRNFRFAASVAEFAMLLRRSPYAGDASFDGVVALAKDSAGADLEGQRAEFVDLVLRAKSLTGK